MSNRRIWITQYGERVPIRNLDDEHLQNIIEFIERRYNATVAHAYTLLSVFQGEQALLDCEAAIDTMEEEGPSFISDKYDDLVEERERRLLRRKANA